MAGAVLILLGAAGVFNGTALVSDPSGHTLRLRVDMLPEWHTWDYRYSGLFVLVALGVVPLICGATILIDVPNTTPAVVGVGVVTLGWVLWQIFVLDIHAPIAHIALAVAGGILLIHPVIGSRRTPL